jgi:hypothetical protein
VGATAALIANIGPPTSPPTTTSPTKSKQDDFNASNFSVTSHEKHQVEELENLVEAGDWTAVMAAATRFETASDTDSLRDLMESRQSMFDESMQGMDTSREQSPEKPSEKSPDNSIVSPESSSPESNAESRSSWSDANPGLRAEIEDLVKSVVPEELENIDEMLLQFRGREDELITTLRTMEKKNSSSSESSKASDGENRGLGASSTSINRDDTSVSVFESDGQDSTVASASRRSSNGTGSQGGSARGGAPASIPEEDDSYRDNGDYGSTIATEQEEMLICTLCSRHLPRSEYSEAQLLLVHIDGARCNECDAMS